jgi:hypothetical protein
MEGVAIIARLKEGSPQRDTEFFGEPGHPEGVG